MLAPRSKVKHDELVPNSLTLRTGICNEVLFFYQSDMTKIRCLPFVLLLTIAFSVSVCEHGLVPPDEPPKGQIKGAIHYLGTLDSWPPADSLADLRFVAMRFIPQDTTDFLLRFNEIVFSDPLQLNVTSDSFTVDKVPVGTFVYSGVAQHYDADLLYAWRPVGLYVENGGIFLVRADETVEIDVNVDFRNLPPFPPPPPE